MKSINFWTALMLCSLFVFSCTNLRIEKRRYNKGLHIHSSSKSRTASSSRETALEKNRAESQPAPSSYTTVSSFDKKTIAPKSSSNAGIDGLHSKAFSVVQSDNMNPKKVATTPRERQNSMNRTDRINNAESVHESNNASKQVSKVSTVKPTHTSGSVILTALGWVSLAVATVLFFLALGGAAFFGGGVGIAPFLIAFGILFLGVIFLINGARMKRNNDKSEAKNASKLKSEASTVKPTHTVGSAILSVFGWIFLALGTLVLIWAVFFFGWVGIFGILIALGIMLLGVILVVIGARIKGNNDKSDGKAASTS